MIYRRTSGLLFTMALAAAVVACSDTETVTRSVGGRTFKIPREHVVDATVIYLPKAQEQSLRFVINPNVPLQHQNMVSIHPDATCPPLDGSRSPDPNCRIVPIPLSRLEQEKLRRVGDDVWWEYRFERGGQLVALCSALDQGEGLCTHYGLYDGLPYELSLRDTQMRELIAIRRATEQMLSEWEVG